MTASYVGKENNTVKFTMEFTAEEFEAAIQQTYLKQRGRIQVPGFRKGKAPRKIIETRYGSGIFFDDAIDQLLQENYPKALDELKIDPIARPKIDFEGDEKIEQGKGFKVVVEAEVAPEVDVKDYKGVKAERELKKVADNAVEDRLATLQKRNSRMIESEEPANWDDTVVLDYKGFVGDEQFEGGTAEDHSLVLGSNTFIPGFEAQLIGVKKGEEKDVVVTFPEEYHAENLAGKEAVFKCTVKDVKKEELPVIDDDFAKEVSEFDTLEELKADILKKAQEQVDKENESAGKEAALAKLCELNPVDIPAAMVNDEVEAMFDQFSQQMMSQGINMDMYCKYMNTTPEEMKKSFEEDAKKRVHTRLVVEAVAAKENMTVTAEEIEKEIEDLAAQYGMEKDRVKELLGSTNGIEKDLLRSKAVDFIYENAKLTEPKKEKKAPAKKAAKKTEEGKEEAPAEEAEKPKKTAKKTTKKATENTEE
ncbi:MAG: trigger factor [Firmicutes bacterium]|nr:trigger factor [Bacillota bacterium]